MSVPVSATTPTLTPTIAQVAAAAASKPAPIPRSRPTPIAVIGSTGSPARLGLNGSPSASSFRRGGRSMGIELNGHSMGASADDSNWRSRGSEVGSIPGSVPKSAGVRGPGPERTVGGFEKREVRSVAGSVGAASALSVSKDKGDKASALSHVPCRFFKAGACTAGSSCPFSHDGGKREVCQWFLKGDCKFGHKCALAHVRPGEPMSMDRRNKKDQQREARERVSGQGDGELGTSPATSLGGAKASPIPTPTISHPVPIRSAISASLQSGSLHSPSRFASSPLREPYGPPAAVVAGSPSAGFGRSLSGAGGFASSPSRPSPLSTSFNARAGGMSLKSGSMVAAHSPLRPPSSSALFSSSFSHSSVAAEKGSGQLSASFAGGARSIWARSETPDEPLSPARRPLTALPSRVVDDVFDEVDDHGEDLLPSSLSDLLTPTERARRMSRTDSREGVAGSPSNLINPNQYGGAERLAQSASAAIPAGNFLEALWSKDGGDARKDPEGEQPVAVESGSSTPPATADLTFTSAQPQPSLRQSLLSQQRTPSSPGVNIRQNPVAPAVDAPYLMRERTDPSSPTTRALQEHAPGQSLPGGIAAALSRMHMQPRTSSGLANEKAGLGPVPSVRREDHDAHDEEALFDMDG